MKLFYILLFYLLMFVPWAFAQDAIRPEFQFGPAQVFSDGDTTPSVSGGTWFITNNSSPTTITYLDDAVEGQQVWILINDNNTTIDFTGTQLFHPEGVDWKPESGSILQCVRHNGPFFCITQGSPSALEFEIQNNGEGITFETGATNLGGIRRYSLGGTVVVNYEGASSRPFTINGENAYNTSINYGGGNVCIGCKTGSEKLNVTTTSGPSNMFIQIRDDDSGTDYEGVRIGIDTALNNILFQAQTAGTGGDNVNIRLEPTGSGDVIAAIDNSSGFFGVLDETSGGYALITDINNVLIKVMRSIQFKTTIGGTTDTALYQAASGHLSVGPTTLGTGIVSVTRDDDDLTNYERIEMVRTASAGTVRVVGGGTAAGNDNLVLEPEGTGFVVNSGPIQLPEEGSAPSGTTDVARIYAEDNGAGKTRLMVIFQTGAAQQIAIEP